MNSAIELILLFLIMVAASALLATAMQVKRRRKRNIARKPDGNLIKLLWETDSI